MDGVFNVKTTDGHTLTMRCNFESLQKSESITFVFNGEEATVPFGQIKRIVEAIHNVR